MVEHSLCQAPVLFGRNQFVLGPRNGAQNGRKIHRRRPEILIMAQRQFAGKPTQEKITLCLIDKCEIWTQPHEASMCAQEIGAEGMKGADRWDERGGSACPCLVNFDVQYVLQALPHL